MHRIPGLLSLSFLAASCQVGPKYEPPFLEMPCAWHSPAQELQESSSDCFLWWESLNDPLLSYLIETAAEQNLDICLAETRILEARAELLGAESYLYPHLDGSLTYGHVEFNKRALRKILGCCHKGSGTKNIDLYEAGFDASWEIDFFGMKGHDARALKARTEAAEEDLCHLRITLAAEVARNYIELRGLQTRKQILEKEIQAQEDTVQLTASLIDAGFTSIIDQRGAEEQLGTLKAEKPQVEHSINKAIHRLSTLLGSPPAALFACLSQEAALPKLPVDRPIGIPSELLRRRPDIKKAERDLAAATEKVGSAIAALFPRITLQGFLGEIGAFCSGGSFTWFGGSQLLMPLFNSTLLEQDVALNKIKCEQAMLEYQKTVLNALEEAENAISAFHFQLEGNHSLSTAQAASKEAYDLTLQLYQKGMKNYLEVSTANRTNLSAEEAYLQSQVNLLLYYVSLYKALGGGWEFSDCLLIEEKDPEF